MGFIEIKRYNIQCDKLACDNMYVVYDMTDDEDEGFIVEVTNPWFTGSLQVNLIDAGWRLINDKVYCAECEVNANEESLFAFLKTDMGII